MSLRARLLRSFAASAIGPVVTSLFQIVTVPLYLHSWGTQLYGEWLILFAVPQYLSLTDFGFATTAATTMTMDVSRGDRDEALRTFQSAWALTTVVTIGLVLLIGLSIGLPLKNLLHLSIMSEHSVTWTVFLFAIYVLLGLQQNIVQAGYRCDGNYAAGMLYQNLTRLTETVVISVEVFYRFSPAKVAAGMLVVRVIGTLWSAWRMKRLSSWLSFGFRNASRERIRSLFKPALGYMAFPIGDALSIQGLTLAIGLVRGPIDVVCFSTLRTLTRFVIQLIRIVMYSVTPEISAAYGVGDMQLANKLHRISCQLSLWLSVIGSAALMLTGSTILRFWTHGAVPMNNQVFVLLLAVVVANSLWHGSSALLLASNRHNQAAFIYLVASALSLGLAFGLMKVLGLVGGAISLLAIDLVYGFYVVRVSLKLLKEPVKEWIIATIRVPRIGLPSQALR